LKLTSDAFPHEGDIPRRHTADGENVSPRVTWSDPPPGTASFALVCEDPDAPAGTWVHWVIYNIPAEAGELPAGTPGQPELPGGARNGKNRACGRSHDSDTSPLRNLQQRQHPA
jgi:hypothetical protein